MRLGMCNGNDVFTMTFEGIRLHVLASTVIEMIFQVHKFVGDGCSKCPHSITKRHRRTLTRCSVRLSVH